MFELRTQLKTELILENAISTSELNYMKGLDQPFSEIMEEYYFSLLKKNYVESEMPGIATLKGKQDFDAGMDRMIFETEQETPYDIKKIVDEFPNLTDDELLLKYTGKDSLAEIGGEEAIAQYDGIKEYWARERSAHAYDFIDDVNIPTDIAPARIELAQMINEAMSNNELSPNFIQGLSSTGELIVSKSGLTNYFEKHLFPRAYAFS